MKKNKLKNITGNLLMLFIWIVYGFFLGNYMTSFFDEDATFASKIPFLFFMMVMFYLSVFVGTIIHESGHLIFGLMSGYKFNSFRIMSFIWIKDGEKIKLKRYSLAGTAGQCLLNPPEMKDGKIPVVLYNIGGSLLNIITGIIFLALYYIVGKTQIVGTAFVMLGFISIILGITNIVPIQTALITNDGYNTLDLYKNRNASKAFWTQLKIQEMTSKGVRIKDMPSEWFTLPSDEELQNHSVAAMGVFSCNYLMDKQQFDEADKRMEYLMSIDSGIIGLHRNLMMCDRIYCELIRENRQAVIEKMLTKEQQKFMKSMKNYPPVLRTEYAYALLAEKDIIKAEKIKAQFKKVTKTYPYKAEIESENELIEIARSKIEL